MEFVFNELSEVNIKEMNGENVNLLIKTRFCGSKSTNQTHSRPSTDLEKKVLDLKSLSDFVPKGRAEMKTLTKILPLSIENNSTLAGTASLLNGFASQFSLYSRNA